MGFEQRVTFFYGVRLPQLSRQEWENKLKDFLSTEFGRYSGIVSKCLEYHNIERSEVDEEFLYEFLTDYGFLLTCEFLDSDFLGEMLLTYDEYEECGWRDMREITEQTFYVGVIGQLIYALFPSAKLAPYMINWVI